MSEPDTIPVCAECGGRLRTLATETVCEECGLVTARDTIDRGPEWRTFDDEDEDRKRTGAPLTRSRHDRGLSTEIGYGSAVRLTGRKRRQLARMRREHDRARIPSTADSNRVCGFTEIRRVVSQLSLPIDVREQACALFESAQSADLLRGRSIEGFAAAAIYAICRTLSIARTVDEIVAIARADEGELVAAYDALNRELGLPTGPIDPAEYLARYASKLELETAVERRAREHVAALRDAERIGGKNPSGVAAACLYAAAGDDDATRTVTQADAAAVADVAPVTIRSTVDDLRSLF
ncbi:transcription initiation factor IIB [Natrialbaceae archaeon AArc-T1-2]|uniref:transcription initiation factor IIB n=1 Tax=Natrialbaceae archaeon AArc-T1-2 TaxID=3053904 RepID=UPI00255AB000|nr:transcription initiation factor IIB family protein [Natrialbaceae archaeon AArc-T1-2]WIV68431.1 transcription initiation factor IIB family protein [Natrialbaceae archaeon AArc-T1-2]